jgi:hypothetical protein
MAEVTFLGLSGMRVYIYGVIGAFFVAHPAFGTFVPVQQDNTVPVLIQGVLFACFHAGGIVAMIAEARQKGLFDMREAARAVCFQPAPERSEREIIFRFAGHLTGEATHAPVKVY